MSMKGMLCT